MTEPLAVTIGTLLRQQHKTLALAESCTGGLIASYLTDVPSSSEYFLGSVVAYAYEAKERLLAVPHDLLLQHGAVSEPNPSNRVLGPLGKDVKARLHLLFTESS